METRENLNGTFNWNILCPYLDPNPTECENEFELEPEIEIKPISTSECANQTSHNPRLRFNPNYSHFFPFKILEFAAIF